MREMSSIPFIKKRALISFILLVIVSAELKTEMQNINNYSI